MKIARNAPCPCGSGRKHKLCCGTTRDEEREFARLSCVFDEIAGLATVFPRLRPTGSAFSAWADRVASKETDATMEEGIALIEPGERVRIANADDEGSATIWQSFFDELGDDELVARAMVTGAAAAAVRERFPPERRTLEALEQLEELRRDPCTALASALEGGDLWSLHESVQADAALAALPEGLDDEEYEQRWEEAISAEAARLGTSWHRERLGELVRRLQSQLPLSGFPAASAALSEACAAYDRDPGLRAELAVALLADSLTRIRFGQLLAA